MCAEVDVVVVNMRGKALERAGLTAQVLRKNNPRLIHCWLAGFGQGGRYAEKAAYDTIIQGASGISGALARVHGTPSYAPVLMADHTVGLIAVQMILLALLQREKTGQGDAIEVPMFENMAAFMLAEHMYLRTFDPPLGGTGDPRILDPQNKPLPTRDGFICISANTNAQAFAFFDAVGRPELKTDPRFCSVAARFENVQAYFEFRAGALLSRTTAEWLEIFDRTSVPAMPYHTFETLMDDPHLREVGLFEKVEHPSEGPIWNIGLPNKLGAGARSDYLPPPKPGMHNAQVLAEFGYGSDEIDALSTPITPKESK
jgi:crotonobetainyl-CoA:carnitine CoA-transferase CaiB-like acyl-CoA transferase